MDGSLLLLVSVLCIGFIPLWTKGWRKFVMRDRPRTAARVCAVVLLSVATLLALQLGPWLFLGVQHGTLHHALADDKILLAVAIMFGPSIVMQIGYAIYQATRGT